MRVCALVCYFQERLFGYDELAKLSADIFVIGHYHVNKGVERDERQAFCNTGDHVRRDTCGGTINHEPKLGFKVDSLLMIMEMLKRPYGL